MSSKEQIVTYYTNARELVKQNHPKAARGYVLKLLNESLKTYQAATSILSKARTGAFLEKWIAVSRDLYDKGVTEYVLECFGLAQQKGNRVAAKGSPKKEPSIAKPSQKRGGMTEAKSVPTPVPTPATNEGIDLAGLIKDAEQTQGWCAEVFELNKRAVVEISATCSSHVSSGTGFIISANGYLLTNDHVVFDENSGCYCKNVYMAFAGGKKRYKLEVLFSDKKKDVALCRFNPNVAEGFTCVKRIADYSSVKQGADCLVVGNAFGMGIAPFTGIIRFTRNDEGNLVYTAPSNPGDSGGPVFNHSGECIGINKSKIVAVNGASAEAYANATPMDDIDALLNKWTSRNGITL